MDINQAARSIIEDVESLMSANFEADIVKELRDLKWAQIDNEDGMPWFETEKMVAKNPEGLPSTHTIDQNQRNIEKTNKVITGGIKIGAAAIAVHVAAGAIVSVLPVVGVLGIAGGVLSLLGQGPLVIATLATAGSVVTSVTSAISNRLTVKKMEDLRTGGTNKGFLEGFVSTITERVYAKAQREKSINNYIKDSLQPDFKQRLEQSGSAVITNIEEQLLKDSQEALDKIQNNLEGLKRQKTEAAGAYQERMARLESYRKALQVTARLR
jgi:hypothetical protein